MTGRFIYKKVIYTVLKDGYLMSYIKTWYKDKPSDSKYYAYRSEDQIISKIKITNPVKDWQGKPLTHYIGCRDNDWGVFPGRLNYSQYCEEIKRTDIWVFNDFTNLSDRAFERLLKIG